MLVYIVESRLVAANIIRKGKICIVHMVFSSFHNPITFKSFCFEFSIVLILPDSYLKSIVLVQ